MQDPIRERTKKFWKTDNYWLALLRDIIVAFLVVAVIVSIVYAYSGSVTPLVAVQSGSMEPHINIGDVVLIRGLNRVPVVTYKEGKPIGYKSFDDYGDVIVYRPNGNEHATPIIHRAMYEVKAGDRLPNNQTAVHDGYITKGDNNQDYDQPSLLGGSPPIEPVKKEWIIGVAKLSVPWIGHLRLALPTVITPIVKVPAECLTDSFTLSRLNPLLDFGGFTAGAKLASKPF
ncbi:MAG: signal peptidase I [Euryarchaeota archaeon]